MMIVGATTNTPAQDGQIIGRTEEVEYFSRTERCRRVPFRQFLMRSDNGAFSSEEDTTGNDARAAVACLNDGRVYLITLLREEKERRVAEFNGQKFVDSLSTRKGIHLSHAAQSSVFN
jgi:hypothetical protein